MKKFVKVLCVILLMAATAGVTFLFTWMELSHNVQFLDADPVAAKVQEVGHCIDRYFIDEYDQEQLISYAGDGAAAAMVAATGDRWSYYISAQDKEAYEEQLYNAYVGVGITISEAEAGFEVVSVAKGGPAEEAGVQAGDILVEVEGQAVTDLESTKALVRGEEGTKVRTVFLRDGQRMELTLTRKSITMDVATGEMLTGNIGLVTIHNFDYHCAEQTLDAVYSLLDQGAEALLFDVRFNPGGMKDEMVEVLDALLPEGDIFKSLDYAGREEVDRSDADCIRIPMAVLVNEDSYSAAEFFAAALQEYDLADVVGMKTCGKGNFQCTFGLSDGSAIALSVGKYFTPSGKSLTDVGITPDAEVPMEDADYQALYYGTLAQEDDVQLQEALRILNEKIS